MLFYAVLEVDYEEKNTFTYSTLYLKECCRGATHVYPYGTEGRYIVIMNEEEYHHFTNRAC